MTRQTRANDLLRSHRASRSGPSPLCGPGSAALARRIPVWARLSALPTLAVENDLVCFEPEAAGKRGRETRRADVDVENAVADTATEVMVMPLSVEFVARGLSGQVHGNDLPLVDHQTEVAIDRRRRDGRDKKARCRPQFLDRQRPISLLETREQRGTLPGRPHHRPFLLAFLTRLGRSSRPPSALRRCCAKPVRSPTRRAAP